MKIAILGFDVEGRSSYEYFQSQGGHELTAHDQNANLELPADIKSVLGDGYLDGLDQYDLLVRTAGLPPQLILDKNPSVASKLTTNINEFFKATPTKNIIGVTGTKGKGTTSTLIAKMLEASGKTVSLGGNIGIPPLSFLSGLDADSWVVLELSSFQLIDLKVSPHIGVCLMVAPEHLNWHLNMDEYTEAKTNLFASQIAEDIAIYFGKNELSQQIASASSGQKVPYFTLPGAVVENGAIAIEGQYICDTAELKLLGEHNWQNACAAVTTVWQITQDIEALRSVLTSFTGLEHRLELVRELDGVKYYDDSFGTTPETAIVALQALEQPKIIILGGSDKGASYDGLAQVVTQSNVQTAILVGDQAGRIKTALEAAGFTNFTAGGSSMTEIVAAAQSAAQSGDVVLLSPACASFGMFKDYKDRGEQFKSAVQQLAGQPG